MRSATIKCDQCASTYSIFEPDFVGDMHKLIQVNTKVSTEVGCPKCLCPDGVLCDIDPLDLPIARYIGSTTSGERLVVPE